MSSKYLARAEKMRANTDVHYNCAQSVILAFAPECGITEEFGYQLGAHFGAGMKMAATCGAITGALMVIGMLGGGDDKYRLFMKKMRDAHEGMTDCAALLKRNAELGQDKKLHCDGMVYEAIENIISVMEIKD